MTNVVIGDILPYTQATAILNQTVFGTNWTANAASDVVVYQTPSGATPNDATQILSYPSDYSVAFIGDSLQVQVTLVTPASAGDIITITRQTPADYLNLYSNTNFTPSMLNNDFGILTLVDQQAQLVNQRIAPRYNYSQQLVDVIDTILPYLPANHFWAKDVNNTSIIAVDINQVISGGTVTQVDTGLGLTGGPITDSGTISFASMPANTFWGNITNSTALPTQVTTGYFLKTENNLSDLQSVSQARINLGLQIGVNVEAWSPALDSIAALTTSANELIYTTASNTYATISAASNSVLVTSNSNVPSLSTTLPSVVQTNITKLGTQSQALNMGSHLINNVTDPVSVQDAATKNYVDTISGAYLPLAGGTMSGVINMGSHQITNVTDPINPQDVATKNYCDTTFLPLAGGTMSGILNMNTHKITNLTNPSVSTDAANKAYVDSTVGNYLPLTGGTMSGVIDMGNHKIINVTDPSLNQDAVNLEYLNTQLALYLPLSGGTMTGAINMNSHKITSVTDPTNPQDAATKNYVDTVASGLTVKTACYAATTANLNATYANGASGIGATLINAGSLATFSIDGTTPAVNSRILVWQQSSTLENGVYTVTNAGSGAVAWILTRATDYDQPSEIQPGNLFIINNGTSYGGSSFVETATVSAIGTDPILFSQFTYSSTAVLLKANNLSDVANTTTSFNNISPLTTKGDLIGYNSGNVRVAVGGTDGQILRVKSAATSGFAWSTATYPDTTTANQILYSSATNVVGGIATTAGGVLTTNSSNVPSFLANPTASNKLLLSVNGDAPAWSTPSFPTSASTAGKVVLSDGTNWVMSTPTFPNASASSGKFIQSDGTNWIASTPTLPTSSGSAGTLLRSDGTNWLSTTTTYPNTNAINTIMYASSANVLGVISPANSSVLVSNSSGVPSWSTSLPSGLTIPGFAASGANSDITSLSGLTGAISKPTSITMATGGALRTDTTAGNTTLLQAYNTNTSAYVTFATLTANNPPTFDLSSSTTIGGSPISVSPLTTKGDIWTYSTTNARLAVASGDGKILQVSSGAATGLAWSTTTYPSSSGTAGQILRSDGTNNVYTTATYPATTTVSQILYSSATNTVSGLATANSSVLVTNSSGVPSLSTTLPNGLAMQTPASINLSNATSLTAAALPAGTMFNFQQAQVTTASTFTNTSFADMTGMSIAITPTSSSNKVLVRAVIQGTSNSSGLTLFQLARNGSAIAIGTSVGSRTACSTSMFNTNNSAIPGTTVIEWLDSPATTSSTTYTVQNLCQSGVTYYLNSTVVDGNSAGYPRMVSTISVCEVHA